MTESEYRQHPAISRSELWKISESPEKFRYYKDHPQEPTPALLFGQALHKLVLEPDGFFDEFAVSPVVDRRTKQGKEEWADFCQSNGNKTIIDGATFEKCRDMAESLLSNPYVGKLLNGEHEKPYFWKDDMTGEDCKCRVDCISTVGGNQIIVDLKTTNDASTESFMRDAIKYGYHVQAAMYSDGVKHNTGKEPLFVFIAVEKEPPYSVNIFQADKLFVQYGYDVFRELIGTYHDCKASGNWFGYLGKYNTVNSLALPAWLAKEVE